MRRRAEAWERFSASSLPTESEEVWRYSGIDAFDLEAFASPPPGDARSESALSIARRLADSLGPRAGLVVTYNAVVKAVEITPSSPEALSVSGALAPVPGASTITSGAPTALGALAPGRDAFGELHDAFVADVVHVAVASKVVVPDPVIVVHLIDPDVSTGLGIAVFPHVLVELGASAEAGVIEIMAPMVEGGALPAGDESETAPVPALVVPVTELNVADDARLRYGNLQVLGHGTTSLALQASRVGRDATLQSFTAGLGGRYARVRTDSDLVGQAGRS